MDAITLLGEDHKLLRKLSNELATAAAARPTTVISPAGSWSKVAWAMKSCLAWSLRPALASRPTGC